MIVKAISRNSFILAVFAAVTTGLIAATNLVTEDRIAEQIRAARERALLEIVPRARHDNNMLDNVLPVADVSWLNLTGERQIFIAATDGKPVAFVIPVIAPDGYSGAIDMVVGVNVDGTIAGARVLRHEETPGLGDKIDLKKSDWIRDFDKKSLLNPTADLWKVKRDKGVFDQFTGATITPRAVTRAIKQTLEFYAESREALVEQATETLATNAQTGSTNDG